MLQMIESVGVMQSYKFAFSSEEGLAQFIRFPTSLLPSLNTDLWKMGQLIVTRQSDGTIAGSIIFSRNGTSLETESELFDLTEGDEG